MAHAQDLLQSGDPRAALSALQSQVRARPEDPLLRVFLFQLLCVLGDWPRAQQQLQLCGTLDAQALAMVNTYREAIACERLREAVFAGRTTPLVLGEPQPWVAWLVQALHADAQGDVEQARRLRDAAFESAPANPGQCDGESFDWMADADSRLGPVLEAVVNGRYAWVPLCNLARLRLEPPADLRDLVWMPAHLDFPHGGETVALIPTRYAGTVTEGEPAALMARRTDWVGLDGADASAHYRGIGQRQFVLGEREIGILELRDVRFDAALVSPAPAAADAAGEAGAASAAGATASAPDA